MEYEKRIEEIHNNYVALEGKVNETIKMVNELILNVNGANQFIAGLHNGLHKAGLIDSPEQIKKEADKLLQMEKQKEQSQTEPEPEMEEVN
jgi:predicted heme/steroid binding protein